MVKACYFGHTEVVNLLLERGADVKPKALEDAIKEGYEYVTGTVVVSGHFCQVVIYFRLIAHALLQSPQWPKAMRHTFIHEGKETTPFRQLIRKMPGENYSCNSMTCCLKYLYVHQGVAKGIMDKCTVSPPNCPDPGGINYSVLFNYEFVEDFRDENHDR